MNSIEPAGAGVAPVRSLRPKVDLVLKEMGILT